MLINNGKGNEFHNYIQNWSQFGEYVDDFGAAGGHFGCQSPNLVRHYTEDLGFEYMTAANKEEFLEKLSRFMTPHVTDKPMLFEVFTKGEDDSEAYKRMRRLVVNTKEELKVKLKDSIRKTVGDNKVRKIVDLLK